MTRFEELHRTWQAMMAERKINVSFDEFLTIIDVADEHPKNPWVSVKERLPEKMPKSDYSEVVFTRNKDGEVGKARYCHQGYMAPRWEHWLYGSGIPSPDYWMPIPKGGEE